MRVQLFYLLNSFRNRLFEPLAVLIESICLLRDVSNVACQGSFNSVAALIGGNGVRCDDVITHLLSMRCLLFLEGHQAGLIALLCKDEPSTLSCVSAL